MPLPKLYILDLDGTLLKRDALWTDFKNLCSLKFNIEKTFFDTTYQEAKTEAGAYDINRHLHVLGVTEEIAKPLIQSLIDTHEYVFPDVIPFLTEHTNDACIILTQGVSWFHHLKIGAIKAPADSFSIVTTLEKKSAYIQNHAHFSPAHVEFLGSNYASLTFIDNMATSFLTPEETHPLLRQYRIRHNTLEDRYATEDTPAHVIEISSLIEIQ